MLPLFEIILGIRLPLSVNLLFLLSCLEASLLVYLDEFCPCEIFEIFPNCGILLVILNKVSLGQKLFTFVFLLCVSSTVDEVHRHFLVVDHLFNLKLNSFLMLDRIS